MIVWYFQPSKTSVYSVDAGYMCRQQTSLYCVRVCRWTECQVLHQQQHGIPHVATEGQNSKAFHIKYAILKFIYLAYDNKLHYIYIPSCNGNKYFTAFMPCMKQTKIKKTTISCMIGTIFKLVNRGGWSWQFFKTLSKNLIET